MISTHRRPGEGESRRSSALRLHPQATLVPELSIAEYRGLCSSIAEHGILVPLDVTHEGVVLDGRARLKAARELGLELVPVRIVEPSDPVTYLVRVAIERRNLSASQKAAIAVRFADYEAMREENRARQRANLRQNAEVATLPPRGKSCELVADIAGVSPRTAQDVITVYEHDSELFEKVVAGTIDAAPAARRVRRLRRDASLSPAPPLPDGPFDVILADPPWQMGSPDSPSAPEQHYPTLGVSEIKAHAVPAAENAVLFLWAVNCLLPEALEVMEAWGFTYKAQIVWVKDRPGTGNWVRNQHELLLIGRKGSFPAPDPEDRVASVVSAKRGRHSQKPACVYELIERMYPHASKLELFARGKARPGWVFWGNEVEESESQEAGG
ncbi:MAG TPA: MT-A70 family methyltransferase [Thermoanaerobaculia bacterium]|nr:MT-A70 family methyltransferase [Thermoanaerobaculia bacterium]